MEKGKFKIPNFISEPGRVLEDFLAHRILRVDKILHEFERRTHLRKKLL